ncbi:HAD family hydrolase [Desulfovibrio sp. JC022]|uniref:HAD family hydrolase n=1 Tax=Desulfovibrio sp. JC022 TaxID=2593642 RepID=UPI0013D09074|nr:HAD family hydrolase [Desulfovibrio sp. JC022]NDV21699.1 HAD family hydrolase [Desulfovibrio sp. JC022]
MFHGKVKAVAFDADDTLWVNEPFFDRAKAEIADMMSCYVPAERFTEFLEHTQSRNINVFGYGVKSFVISMIEAANKVADGRIKASDIARIIELGRDMLNSPVEHIEGVESVLHALGGEYKLLMITKGDVAEQQRKISLSGMSVYFEHIEILAEKDEAAYERILHKHSIRHEEFLMVGNSVKSDVLPVVGIGGSAVHIPFHTTWAHEVVSLDDLCGREYVELSRASELLPLLLSL